VTRHRLDPISLVAGVVFASIGLLSLFTNLNGADIGVRWIWPLPVIVLGLLLLTIGDHDEGSSGAAEERRSADEVDSH
jgi:hypothetical protein